MVDLGTSLKMNNAMPTQTRGHGDILKVRQDSTAASLQSGKSSRTQERENDTNVPSRFSDRLNNKMAEGSNSRSASAVDRREVRKNSESDDVEATESRSSKKANSQQAAMALFLQRLQSELGVDPDKLVEAFSELSPEELVSAPEDSAKSLIAKLDLTQEQNEKALGYYNEMLAMTAASSMSAQLAQNNQTANFQVMSKKEAQLQELRASLNDLSDRFFVTGSHMGMRSGIDQQAKIAQAQAAYEQAQMTERQNADAEESALKLGAGAGLSEGAGNLGSQLLDQAGATATDVPAGMSSVNAASENPFTLSANMSADSATTDAASIVSDADGATNGLSTDVSDFNALADEGAPNLDVQDLPSSDLGKGIGAAGVLKMMGDDTATASSNDDSQDDLTSDEQLMMQDKFSVNNTTKVDGAKSFHVSTPQATPADMQSNVKEIISQARFLASKGGGEMKVKLNPEGMGELDLKVKMINGKVNVEMVTTNDEAKKLLEKGLADLKENLATHKLHLDSVKIDSSRETSKHMDQQMADAERGFEQKFLNDFRERNQGWKREMFELGSATMPQSQVRDSVQASSYGSGAYKKRDTSRRLDLVA